ncbi:outer membrane protein OmpA-like peptidoglycan-associated protein [Balneicella halophila]|uniref:Outer membrane protein OmpA-like peptidoglycan-associated protein n=1 Tax=Balneicella halophila TaxID=1537566 RepID=A0A7L4UR23_BALHA|nr:OmpA family protein [Balneicella halophila]PVX52228.1 outer membrane protein OmpA-like peptidoglycan-associated protein [Balneicella halophila]
MKRTIIYTISLFCLFSIYSEANAKGIKEKVADSYYENLAYKKAIPYYVELAESKKANDEIVRKTADSFNKIGDTKNAVKWYEVLYTKGWATTNDKYEYFLLLRKNGSYEKSLIVMNDYLENGGFATDFIKYLKENPNYLQDLQKKNAGKYKITKLNFNSPEHDFGATYYKDGILFASPEKRGERVDVKRKFAWDNTNFLQLYYVPINDGKYGEPEKFTFAKKNKYHDGPVAFNSDFTEAYVTRSNYSPKGRLEKSAEGIVEINLYLSKKNQNGEWSELAPFQYNSSEYSIGCATISHDGNFMVFASDMPGGVGETDLWMSKRENAAWGSPVHLGEKINTARRDNFPHLDKDGNLYFASDGGIHGFGGYDVFWIPGFLDGKDDVYNLGAPINSEADDFGFIYNSDDATGYFNSGRKGVVGDKGADDIFAFEKLVSMLEVQVIDKDTKQPILAANGCFKSEFGDFIEQDIKLNDQAKFNRELTAKTYLVCANADGYEPGETKVVLPKGKFVTAVIELEKTPEPEPKEINCPEITLEDIFYDFDKYYIRDDASASLDDLLSFLKEYPEIRVNLVSHTDSRGTHKYNEWLSQKRAESAVNYLVERGIARERLTARGAGETQLLNGCADGVKCSEVEHQVNRRTTVEIISSDCVEVNKRLNKYLIKE